MQHGRRVPEIQQTEYEFPTRALRHNYNFPNGLDRVAGDSISATPPPWSLTRRGPTFPSRRSLHAEISVVDIGRVEFYGRLFITKTRRTHEGHDALLITSWWPSCSFSCLR